MLRSARLLGRTCVSLEGAGGGVDLRRLGFGLYRLGRLLVRRLD